MKTRSEFIGLPVLNIKDGHKLATVKDILYSRKKFRVLGILVNEGGLFKEAEVIRFKNIDKIGKDAVMIKSKKVVEKACHILEIDESLKTKSKVIGEEVMTEDGESLGLIHDVIVDESNGRILAFILSGGLIDDIKDGRNMIPYTEGIRFGEDRMLVSNDLKMSFEKNKGDFKKLLGLL